MTYKSRLFGDSLIAPNSSSGFSIRTVKKNRWRHSIDGRGGAMAPVVSNIKSCDDGGLGDLSNHEIN
jgi:hypothetical protein